MSDKNKDTNDVKSAGVSFSSGSFPIIPVVAAVVVAAGAAYYFMASSDDPASSPEVTAAVTKVTAPDFPLDKLMKAGPLGENVLGKDDAPVTIIEYSSMTCSHCATFHKTVYVDLKKNYIDTGKVRYILREFPLDNLASAAFMLARCAGPDKYFPLVEALYASQESWAYGEGDPTQRLFKAAKLAGASFTQKEFEACLQRQDLLDGVNWVRKRGGEEFKIQSTPSFFINGKLLKGAQNIEKFEEAMKPYL